MISENAGLSVHKTAREEKCAVRNDLREIVLF